MKKDFTSVSAGPAIFNGRCACCGGTNITPTGNGCRVCYSRTWLGNQLLRCSCGYSVPTLGAAGVDIPDAEELRRHRQQTQTAPVQLVLPDAG